MAKNRVGSLYYEIALDAGGFARQGARIRKDSGSLAKALKKHRDMMSPEQRLREDRNAQLKTIQRSKLTYEQKRTLIKSQFAYERRELAKIDRKRHEMALRDRKRSSELAAAKRNKAFGGGLLGTGNSMMALGAFSNMVKTATMQILPFVAAGYVAVKMFKAMAGAIMSVVYAADKKKKQLMTLAGLFDGNMSTAKGLRKELQEYAAATAFSVEQTMEMATTLRTFGFEADQIVTKISQFGKLAFGDPDRMKRIAKAFTDVQGKGKLMARELQQFAEAGVPLRQMLMDLSGKDMAELMQSMEDGAISFETVEDAVEKLATKMGDSDKLGLFTVAGNIEAIKEEFQETLALLGEAGFQDILFAFVKGIRQALEALNDFLETMVPIINKMLPRILEQIAEWSEYLGHVFNGLVPLNRKLGIFFAKMGEGARVLKENIEANRELEDQAMKKAELMSAEIEKTTKLNRLKAEAIAKDKEQAGINELLERQQAELNSLKGDDALKNQFELQDAIKDAQDEMRKAIGKHTSGAGAEEFVRRAGSLAEAIVRQKRENKAHEEKMKKDKEIAEEQKKLYEELRKSVERAKDEAAKKAVKDAQAEMDAKKEELSKRKKAANAAAVSATSFTAGSVEEFEFRKNQILQREKIAAEKKIADEEKAHREMLNQRLVDKLQELVGMGGGGGLLEPSQQYGIVE